MTKAERAAYMRAYYHRNKERLTKVRMEKQPAINARQRERRQAAAAKKREYNRAYYEAHREEIRAQQAAYAEATRQRINARMRARYHADPAKAAERHRAYALANKGKIAARRKARAAETREYQRGRYYGMKPGEFAAMLAAQGGVCAICRRPPADFRVSFAVDHCHETGAVRGILCFPCNSGMGALGDDPDRLEVAAAYLRRATVRPAA